MNQPPKLILALALLALGGAGYWYFRDAGTEAGWLGYVEAETMYIAAPVSGRLASRSVERGARVETGAMLFSLDPETTDADTARAEAQVAAAQAQRADLGAARERAAELDVARAGEAAARAALIKAQTDFDRIAALYAKGFASRAQYDAARAARDSASAQVAQARARIRSGELTVGRAGQQAAAGADVAGAEAALRGQRQLRRDIAPVSPTRGVVEQTFYNPGEWVPANMPVVSILPDARRKLRFYVPQERIAALKPGLTVTYTCDGCGGPRTARLSYIAPRAEFSPPVIYSEKARAKLVFLVEALLPATAEPLPPGLPVEVVPQ